MKVNDYIYPSFLVTENLFAIADDEETLFRTTERILSDGFYKKVELATIKNPAMCRKYAKMIGQLGLEWVQWLTADINELKLNPSTTDNALRKRTIEALVRLVENAAQSGANHVVIIGGPDCPEALRGEATKGLEEVLMVICEKLSQYPGMKLLLEPLDRGAHKNNLIGPTPEAVALMERVNRAHNNCRIAWDSAHVALNKEDFGESLRQSAPFLGQLHIANAIVDPQAEGYGDWHMPMGKPGVITQESGREILRAAAEAVRGALPISVAIETRCLEAQEIMRRVETNRKFLEEILLA